MDPSHHSQDCGTTATIAHSGECPHGCPFAPQATFLAPRESQKDRPQTPPPRRAVRPDPQTASAFWPARESRDQRRRQEEGIGRELQEPRHQVGSHSHPGQRPRFSVASPGRGHSLWHLRPRGQVAALCSWASLTKPPPSPSPPSAVGGSAKDGCAITIPNTCSFWLTPAGAIRPRAVPGRTNFNSSVTALGSPSRSPTIRPERRNTILLSAVCSVPSAETGRASRSKVTRRS